MSRSGAVPGLTRWFRPYGNFDLKERGLPVNSFYEVSCAQEPCLRFSSPSTLEVEHRGNRFPLSPFDGRCGNVHFPPNATQDYDSDNASPAQSSCVDFGRGNGPNGEDLRAEISNTHWSQYQAIAPDCSGDFLVWWYQNMPGHQTGQRAAKGADGFKSVWPFLFY
jgi:hypothetical protein